MTVNIKLMNKDKKMLVPTRSTKDFSILSNINYPITLSVMNDFSEYRKYIKVFFYFFCYVLIIYPNNSNSFLGKKKNDLLIIRR